ncbi:MAG: threonine--tRNA ligase [Gemmatimonadetes bacterium]|jgi:threonyl-tRNA synthetase|nr:threonine--tRNA ligase [Gemmatimonadota bacterium]MDE0961712.1 threonine--tRNA ligase [Candidatus Latescibacterota bacterium]MBT5325595.1 threonine--tRNA ligase [Gemmatimonadota bacterium]MBT5449985.1 threonine--tRNA ligase [Gemmatimonadota bacterium]MBT5802181.1 threonine--tRNA ligase [Gemmatimonadota bacterium]
MLIKVPQGQDIEYAGEGTLKEIFVELDKGLLKKYIAARAEGEHVDFHTRLRSDAEVELIPWDAEEAAWIYRHSMSHVLAQAVVRLFPEAQLAIGPAIEDGFYYDFDVEEPFTPEDLKNIEKEMKRVIKQNHKFERVEVSREQALEKIGDATYKNELLADLAEDQTLSFYQDGEFVDLCRGPHMLGTGQVKHFKLLSVAGAYWRGDESRKMLQRIYGTAFATREALDQHIAMLEEAKKRDHRLLGKQLELFHIDEEVGQGLVLWMPNGAVVRTELQNFISAELRRQGYKQVYTPHIGKLDLYRTSGHFPYYQDGQYPPFIEKDHLRKLADEGCSCGDLASQMEAGDIDGYLLKPMNCPHHIKIFASKAHSYRDLPVRLAEFGTVYRWEQSGEIGGMTRVRGFTQDDAHLFCMEEQVAEELLQCLELVKIIFGTLGMADYRVRVGLRDPDSSKYVGEPAKWDRAEEACRQAAESLGVPFSEEPGEAAFYGPKIDFVVKDVVGREWQLGTVQVDYNLPERFGLEYAGADGQMHRPVMIHRAPFGSMERFVGVLIEHFAGAFPVWLAPVQAVVLPIAERHAEFGAEVRKELLAAGIRVELDAASETLNKRIRQAQMKKVPYMLIAGDREVEEGQVSIRLRSGENLDALSVADAVAMMTEKVAQKAEV